MDLWACSQAWEGRAYDYCMENLKNMGFPVDGLSFDPELVIVFILLKGSTLLVSSLVFLSSKHKICHLLL